MHTHEKRNLKRCNFFLILGYFEVAILLKTIRLMPVMSRNCLSLHFSFFFFFSSNQFKIKAFVVTNFVGD